jgi:hypothetical protein
MATRSSPEDLWDLVTDVQRRLSALETSPRTGKASIPDGGALVVLNNAGTAVLRIGTLTSGGYGIERWSGSAWEPDAVPDADWRTPSLLNSWVNFDTSSYAGARYRKLSSGQVEVQGLVKSGTTGAAILQLPVGMRPSNRLVFNTFSDLTTLARFDILADGNLFHMSGGNGFISINCTFTPG